MTRDEVVFRLRNGREAFDKAVAEVPPNALDAPIEGLEHSAKQIVAHVTAYEQLIVERLIASRHGATTSLEPDSEGWEAFNSRMWNEASTGKPRKVLSRAADVFGALVHEVDQLSDEELNAATGATAALDPRWLQGRAPWQVIAEDAYDHYRQHLPALEKAGAAARR